MKFKTNFLFTCLIFTSLNVFAQLNQDTRENLPTAEQYQQIKKYDAVVKFPKKKLKGVIYKVTDEAIILLPKSEHIKRYSHFEKLTKKDQKIIALSSISKVTTRESGKLRRSFWIGAGIGAGIGIYGLIAEKEGDMFEGLALLVAVPITLIGGGIGALIGASSKSHKLNEAAQLEQLKKRAIMFRY